MLDFVFEGGYDQYNWSQYKLYGHENEDSQKSAYSLYAYPGIQGTYQVTPAFSVYAIAGAEYRNWAIESEKISKSLEMAAYCYCRNDYCILINIILP